MENSRIASDEIEIEFAGESDETEDPLTNGNTIDTSANANMSIRQVYPWISHDIPGNMSVEEVEIEEIKIESTDKTDPSVHPCSEQCVTEKAVESGQTESSMPGGTAPHNEIRYRRLRCKFCSLLFISEKTLTTHQKKCKLVCEKMNAPRTVPARGTYDILEDLQKRLPQFTVAITENENAGTSSRADDGTPVPQSHHRKSDSVPIDITVTMVPKLEVPPASPISIPNTDPLKLETTMVQKSANFIPPVSFATSVSSTVPCNSSTVLTTSGAQYNDQESSAAVPQQTAAIDIAVQLERIENKLALLSKENCMLRESLAMSNLPIVQEHGGSNVFDFERLTTQNQLDEFEVKLGQDIVFADRMVSLLKKQTANYNPSNRIVLSLDFLLSRQLFASCTWTGKHGLKIPFYKYENIRILLRRVSGSTSFFVENILRSRLINAASRLRCNPGRRPFCKQKLPERTRKN